MEKQDFEKVISKVVRQATNKQLIVFSWWFITGNKKADIIIHYVNLGGNFYAMYKFLKPRIMKPQFFKQLAFSLMFILLFAIFVLAFFDFKEIPPKTVRAIIAFGAVSVILYNIILIREKNK